MTEKKQEFSKAHPAGSMNMIGNRFYPDGSVPYDDAREATEKDPNPRPRSCAYCGSMHPDDVVQAIYDGARLELADMKYGYPHKIYLHGIPKYDHGKIYTNHLRDASEAQLFIICRAIGIEFTFDEKGMGWRQMG